jgi:2-dehydro-3-deoxyphosphooctonate aldolase (KDO 8-P synthase)
MNIQHIPQLSILIVATSLLAGPCAIESEEMAMQIAEKLIGITDKLEIPSFLRVF